VLWKLTGGASHATDFTNASRTMLFDIGKRSWDAQLLKTFGVPAELMPEVKRSSCDFGKTIRIGRLPKGIPVCGIAGDQQAALFGQACFGPGGIKNTYGTGCFLLLNAGEKRPVSKHGLITTLACGPKGEPVYALEGAVFIEGPIQWLRDGLGLCLRLRHQRNGSIA
jgi:glycerol kinase